MGLYHHSFETRQEAGGKFSERDVLGAVDAQNPDYLVSYDAFILGNRKLLEKFKAQGIKRLSKEERKKLFTEGVELVESFPAEDPVRPERPLLRDLRLEIANLLELQGEDIDLIKIYSSVGTPVDRLFGTDGFIRLDDVDGKRKIYVTFDYTTGQKRVNDSGADVVIFNLPDPDLAEDEYIKAVDGFAYDIFKILLRRKSGTTNTPY